MEATMSTQEQPQQRKSLLSRFRRGRKAEKEMDDKRESTPSPVPVEPEEELSEREESVKPEPIETAPAKIEKEPKSEVKSMLSWRSKSKNKRSKTKTRSPRGKGVMVKLDAPPPAREAAFSGPPRYDWIDIETAAAIKVQAAYRRNKVMADLERNGQSTAAIRNRARRREATIGTTGSDDIPNLFRCCGVGLAFGDGTEEDYATQQQYQRAAYEKKRREKEEREAKLRRDFHRIHMQKLARREQVAEAYEVVE